MAQVKAQKDYNIILSTFLKYLPSRFLVILNSLIIVPFFAFILSAKEMGLYQISIGALNLLCTCSTDWISKSALRFYEKYKIQNKIEDFFSNIIFLSLAAYALIIIVYLFLADDISQRFYISKDLLLLTLILIIPCGIRQFLYQMLRVLNKPFLYTFSIIIYQFAHLILFLVLFKLIDNNVIAILTSMTIAMLIIDIYILREINLQIKLKFKPDFALVKESLKYSLPTVITNTSIWALLHINKFIFQTHAMFDFTAIAGIAWLVTSYILTPLLSAFLFAVFPIIIKRFEHNQQIKSITTCTIRLYCMLFIPLAAVFVFYSKEITNILFDAKYEQACIIIPFFALTIFLHELMKLLNVKYHLKNRTYLEMIVSVISGGLCVWLNLKLIPIYHLTGAGIAMLFSILLMIFLHSLIRFKSLDYIFPSKIFKTAGITLLIGLVLYAAIAFTADKILLADIPIIKVITFLLSYYTSVWFIKDKILN